MLRVVMPDQASFPPMAVWYFCRISNAVGSGVSAAGAAAAVPALTVAATSGVADALCAAACCVDRNAPANSGTKSSDNVRCMETSGCRIIAPVRSMHGAPRVRWFITPPYSRVGNCTQGQGLVGGPDCCSGGFFLKEALGAAAVHRDGGAVDGAGALRCEKGDQRRQFFWPGEPTDGHIRGGLLQNLLVGDPCILRALFEKFRKAIGERIAR